MPQFGGICTWGLPSTRMLHQVRLHLLTYSTNVEGGPQVQYTTSLMARDSQVLFIDNLIPTHNFVAHSFPYQYAQNG